MPTEVKEEVKYKELIHKFYDEFWLNRNFAIIDEMVAPNVKCYEAGMEINSFEEYKSFSKLWFDAIDDVKYTITNQLVKENVVVSRFVFEGTHKGKLGDLAPTGKKFKIASLDVVRFVNDKIAEVWAEFDQLGMMQQLGMELRPKELAH